MVWSQYSILNIVIHGAQTPKYKIVYVNHLPEYCPVMLAGGEVERGEERVGVVLAFQNAGTTEAGHLG